MAKKRRKKTNYVGEATGTLVGTFVGIRVTYPLVAAAPPIASDAVEGALRGTGAAFRIMPMAAPVQAAKGVMRSFKELEHTGKRKKRRR